MGLIYGPYFEYGSKNMLESAISRGNKRKVCKKRRLISSLETYHLLARINFQFIRLFNPYYASPCDDAKHQLIF